MPDTAKKFSAAARDSDPSFEHWSTYLKEESREAILELIHENLPELFERKDFGPAATLPNTVTNDNMAKLLAILASEENLDNLDKILEAGIPIDIRDKNGTHGLTALQHTSRWLYLEDTKALLDRGANPEIRDREGRSALDHVVTSRLLVEIEETTSRKARSDFLRRLFNRGSQESDIVREIIDAIAQRGANLYAQDANGHTAFAKALLAIKPTAVKAVLDMADAGEFDLLGSKVSGDLTAKQFCHGYSEGIAKGEVSGTDTLFQICYHAGVEIDIRQYKADCKKLGEEVEAGIRTLPPVWEPL